jgi:hypothetical protein
MNGSWCCHDSPLGPGGGGRPTSGRLNGFPSLLFAFQRPQAPRLSTLDVARPSSKWRAAAANAGMTARP